MQELKTNPITIKQTLGRLDAADGLHAHPGTRDEHDLCLSCLFMCLFMSFHSILGRAARDWNLDRYVVVESDMPP